MSDHPLPEDALAALDREWQADRSRMLVRDSGGELREPGDVIRPVRDVLGVTGSILGVALLSALPLPNIIPLLGLVPFAFYLYRMMTASARAEAFERAKTAYESQRAALLRRQTDDLA